MSISIQSMKDQAKRLRASLAENGETVGHSHALELVARQHGYRDWNTAHAALGNRPSGPPVELGGKARGRYLGQPFTAKVIGIQSQLAPGRWRVELQFDEPVDVVTFDSFSAFRQRVNVMVDDTGVSPAKTSDGEPHMVIWPLASAVA